MSREGKTSIPNAMCLVWESKLFITLLRRGAEDPNQNAHRPMLLLLHYKAHVTHWI